MVRDGRGFGASKGGEEEEEEEEGKAGGDILEV